MTNKEKATALVPVTKFAIASADIERRMEIFHANTGGQLKISDLTVVKMPQGTTPVFTIPSALGEDDAVKEITGVVIHWQERRAYWPKSIDEAGGGGPPQCQSSNGKTGIGSPGGDCRICPMAKFGPNSERPRCQTSRPVYIVRPGSIMPLVIRASVTSIGPIQRYMLALATDVGVGYWQVQTRFVLERAKNRDNTEYMRLKVELAGKLAEAEQRALDTYRTQIVPLLDSAPYDPVLAGAATEDVEEI